MKYNMHTARKGYRCIPIQLRTQCIRILNPQKSLMTENDRDLNDRNSRQNEKDRSPRIEVSGRFSFMIESAYYNKVDSMFLSHAARYSERSSDSGQYADGYLQNCFPSVRFHLF